MLDTDDKGLQVLFFSDEYQDFQRQYMDDVLSGPAFAPFIDVAPCPELVRGYMSAYLGMFAQWKASPHDRSLDDFVDCAASLFEHGLGK